MSWIATGSCGSPPSSRKELEIRVELSTAEIENPVEKLEQYATPSTIASSIAWEHRNLFRNRVAVDLGCGTGRLLLSALLVGASYGVGVEVDPRLAAECLEALRRACLSTRADVVRADATRVPLRPSARLTVVMNPPFGTRVRGVDRGFLEAAFNISPRVITVHYDDPGVRGYLERLSSRKGFRLSGATRYRMMLKQALVHHRSRRKYIPVAAYVFYREGAGKR